MKHKEEAAKAIAATMFHYLEITKIFRIMRILEDVLDEDEKNTKQKASFESCLYIVLKEQWLNVFGELDRKPADTIDPF